LFAVNRGQLHGRLHGYAVMNQALRLKTGQMPHIVLDDGRNVDLAALTRQRTGSVVCVDCKVRGNDGKRRTIADLVV